MAPTSNVPKAAAVRPYSVSTLRKYSQTWEEMYGALPRSRRDNSVQLVDPLLDIFDSAFEHGVGKQTAIKDRIVEVVMSEAAALPRVVTGYSEVLGRQDLIGVEHTISRLQAHCLENITVRLEEVVAKSLDILLLDRRLNQEFSILYKNLANITEGQLVYTQQAMNAANSYIESLMGVKRASYEIAQVYERAGHGAPGAE